MTLIIVILLLIILIIIIIMCRWRKRKCCKPYALSRRGQQEGRMDGPQHVLEMVNCVEAGPKLVSALTVFTNCLLHGEVHADVSPVLFGGNLIALHGKEIRRHASHRCGLHSTAYRCHMCQHICRQSTGRLLHSNSAGSWDSRRMWSCSPCHETIYWYNARQTRGSQDRLYQRF